MHEENVCQQGYRGSSREMTQIYRIWGLTERGGYWEKKGFTGDRGLTGNIPRSRLTSAMEPGREGVYNERWGFL